MDRSGKRGRADDTAKVEIAGVRVTHPDRVLFAGQGVTKRMLIDYYLTVADRILAHVADRPLALMRCPCGSGKQRFFQKHANSCWPDAFKHVRIREKSGSGDYLYIEDERGLVTAVQIGVLVLHLWGAKAEMVERPDRLVFDLDPDEGLPFAAVIKASLELKKRLEAIDITSFAMATGGKGLHVVIPLKPHHRWDRHKEFAEAMARQVAEDDPDRYVATMSKAKRRRIFIDHLRNTRGASATAPYSTRARAPTRMWRFRCHGPAVVRLKDAQPASVKNAVTKLPRAKEPWRGYFSLKQILPKLTGRTKKGRREGRPLSAVGGARRQPCR